MRICLSAIVILLGANLLINLLDSDMMEVINERNETIQRQIDQMWQLVKVSTKTAQTPKIVYLIGVEGTAPHHTSQTFLPASHA